MSLCVGFHLFCTERKGYKKQKEYKELGKDIEKQKVDKNRQGRDDDKRLKKRNMRKVKN